VLRKYLIPEYLHNISTLSAVVFIYMVSEQIQHESGLLATTIMGVWLANMKNVRIEEIINFKESLSILLISSLFLLLAARLDISLIPQLGWKVLIFLAIVQFIIRPISVWVCTLGSKLDWRERALICWISPRGIVAAAISSLFVIRLQEKGVPQAEVIVPLTFILIIGTVVFQSLSTKFIANILKVADPAPNGVLIVGANKVSITINQALHEAGVRTMLADTSWSHIQDARMAGLRTYYGNPTSGHADEHLDLSGIGKLIALSTRRETNALASLHFRPEFGMDSIFSIQNQPNDKELDKHEPISKQQPNPLFTEDITYKILRDRIANGEGVSATELTEKFNYDEYKKKYGTNSILMFAIDKNYNVFIYSDPEKLNPQEGWTLIRLGPTEHNNKGEQGSLKKNM
jgi:NhaP-type Na+/H+ or K+/H+ antiporter